MTLARRQERLSGGCNLTAPQPDVRALQIRCAYLQRLYHDALERGRQARVLIKESFDPGAEQPGFVRAPDLDAVLRWKP